VVTCNSEVQKLVLISYLSLASLGAELLEIGNIRDTERKRSRTSTYVQAGLEADTTAKPKLRKKAVGTTLTTKQKTIRNASSVVAHFAATPPHITTNAEIERNKRPNRN
jgi:hypothetical protein